MVERLTGHVGAHAVAVARAHGVATMFTLSGAHVFPLYDGAVKAQPPMPIIDYGTKPPQPLPPKVSRG
jgi:acetolactate synthase-1/2/3 large subunit